MRQLFDDIATAVKSEMPNAKFSFDISAWLSESAMTTWWGNPRGDSQSPKLNKVYVQIMSVDS
jgi:hypothetical protein